MNKNFCTAIIATSYSSIMLFIRISLSNQISECSKKLIDEYLNYQYMFDTIISIYFFVSILSYFMLEKEKYISNYKIIKILFIIALIVEILFGSIFIYFLFDKSSFLHTCSQRVRTLHVFASFGGCVLILFAIMVVFFFVSFTIYLVGIVFFEIVKKIKQRLNYEQIVVCSKYISYAWFISLFIQTIQVETCNDVKIICSIQIALTLFVYIFNCSNRTKIRDNLLFFIFLCGPIAFLLELNDCENLTQLGIISGLSSMIGVIYMLNLIYGNILKELPFIKKMFKKRVILNSVVIPTNEEEPVIVCASGFAKLEE